MTLVRNEAKSRNEWVLGLTAESLPNSFYIAVDDSADGDNTSAGTLQGLSVRGDYEISTSAFKDNEVYYTGDALTADGTTGNLKKATLNTQLVIAHVVKDFQAPIDLGATYTGLQPEEGGLVSPGVQGGVFVRPRESNAQNLELLRVELVAPYLHRPSA